MRTRKEDYRFVVQECEKCGARFPVVYMFKENTIAPFGFACEHIPKGESMFNPEPGMPTFNEWHKHQVRVRRLLTTHA